MTAMVASYKLHLNQKNGSPTIVIELKGTQKNV